VRGTLRSLRYQPITSGSPPLLSFAQEDWLDGLSIVESEQY
jgi:hypothetical protein